MIKGMADLDRSLDAMLSYVTRSHNKSHTLKKILALPQWETFCRVSSASELFDYFRIFFLKLRCDSSAARVFFGRCGHQVADWVVRDGRTNSLELLLSRAHDARFDLWKGRCSPLVKSVYLGRWTHVPVLLKFGYTLEFSDRVYRRLVVETVREFVMPCHQHACKSQLLQSQNPNRTFLLLLVIRTYLTTEISGSAGCDRALRHIFSRQPSSILGKEEFPSVFHPFHAVQLDKLQAFFLRYRTMVRFGMMDQEGHGPYTLLHYSRCQVRKVMGQCMSLPNGVEELDIPEELKPYLKFQ